MKHLMHPVSGEVQTEREWIKEYLEMAPELWGGPKFEDAGLIEVVKDTYGEWVEGEWTELPNEKDM